MDRVEGMLRILGSPCKRTL